MRRVVVTGMGIVSSIGNNTQEVLASLRERRSRASAAPRATPNSVSAAPGAGRAEHQCRRAVRRRAMRFMAAAQAWNHVAMDQAHPRCRPRGGRYRQRAHRHHHGLGRSVDKVIVEACCDHQGQGSEAHRAVRGAEGSVVDGVGDARDLQDQGRQLLDLRPARRRTTASATPTR